MERLTYKYNDGYAINLPNAISGKDETLRWSISERESGLRLEGEIPNRLAAYEDTGLEPQEIKSLQAEWAVNLRALDAYRALGSVDRLRELAQAAREGRCVILPCKRGDTVWFIKSAFSVAAFPIEANHVSIRGIDCDGDVLYAAITDYNKIERHFKSSDISKTVFLTRAEAEEALRREQDD